jgi:phage shock protein E
MSDARSLSERARQLVAGGALLLDVRTPDEYRQGHLPGAVNIPVQELARRLPEVEPRSRPVVVYCAAGMRAQSATLLLERSGFEDVLCLGGMSAW